MLLEFWQAITRINNQAMIYSIKVLTTAGSTGIGSLLVTKGLVYRVELMFPPGSGGLLKVAIFRGASQVWPSPPGEVFDGDYMLISFEDLYVVESQPFIFTIKTDNQDTKYEHEVTVRIGLVSATIFMARFLPNLAVDMQKDMWQELIQVAAEEKKILEAIEAERILSSPFPWLEVEE